MIMANRVPMNAITIVCKSFIQTSRCCQEDVVPGERKVATGRIDALAACDERCDLACGFAEERRIRVEEEVLPAEEAFTHPHPLRTDVSPAGESEVSGNPSAGGALLYPIWKLTCCENLTGSLIQFQPDGSREHISRRLAETARIAFSSSMYRDYWI